MCKGYDTTWWRDYSRCAEGNEGFVKAIFYLMEKHLNDLHRSQAYTVETNRNEYIRPDIYSEYVIKVSNIFDEHELTSSKHIDTIIMKELITTLTFLGTIVFGIQNLSAQEQWKAHFPNDSTYIGQLTQVAFDTAGNANVIAWNLNKIILYSCANDIWSTDTIMSSYSGALGFVIDNNNTKWISAGIGLHKIENGVLTSYNKSNSPIPGDGVGTITKGANNDIWFACTDQVDMTYFNYIVKYDGNEWLIFDSASTGMPNEGNAQPKNIEYDPINDVLYVSTWQPLGLFKYSSQSWSNINDQNSDLPYCSIYDIGIDTEGNLWLSTHHFQTAQPIALIKFDGNTMTSYEMPPDSGTCFEVDSNNNLWYERNDSFTIMKFDGTDWTVFHIPSEYGTLPLGGLDSSKIDPFNTLWITGFNSSPFPQIIEFNENGIITGLSHLKDEIPELTIYPNPTSDFLIIPNITGLFEMDIYSIEGKKIIASRNLQDFHIDIRSLTSGTYLLKLTQDSKVFHSRFIKN